MIHLIFSILGIIFSNGITYGNFNNKRSIISKKISIHILLSKIQPYCVCSNFSETLITPYFLIKYTKKIGFYFPLPQSHIVNGWAEHYGAFFSNIKLSHLPIIAAHTFITQSQRAATLHKKVATAFNTQWIPKYSEL